MAKFRLPEKAQTRLLVLTEQDERVVLRFNKSGEAKCADKYIGLVQRQCPNLELLEEQAETE